MQQDNNIQQNMRIAMDENAIAPRVVTIQMLYDMIFIIASLCMLIQHYDASCKTGVLDIDVKTMVIALIIIRLNSTFITLYRYLKGIGRDLPNHPTLNSYIVFHVRCSFVWLILGTIMFYGLPGDCVDESPQLLYYATTVVTVSWVLTAVALLWPCLLICCLPCIMCLIIVFGRQDQGAPPQVVEQLPIKKCTQEAVDYNCSICLTDYVVGDDIKVLPCNHEFHPACVDRWLIGANGTCPLCRAPVVGNNNVDDIV
jgi:hypothetical protein